MNEWINNLQQSLVTPTHTGNVYKGLTDALPHGSVPKTVWCIQDRGGRIRSLPRLSGCPDKDGHHTGGNQKR